MPENRPIRIVRAGIHRDGAYRVHTSIFDLAETLLNRWPHPEEQWGEAHYQARHLIVECYEGRCTVEDAREAFIVALDEAGISIMLEDREPRYPVVPAQAKPARKRRAPMDGGTNQ